MKKKIIFIVNPISGHHNKNNFPNLVNNYIDKNQFEYKIVYTERANHPTELTMQAIEEGYEYIAAVGGDGTINEVAKCLIGKEQILIIVPLGSGNGLARHLGLPFKTERLINEVINKGKVYKIDTASMNGTPFISIAGIGFDALIADYFAKDGNRGWKTYAKLITEKYPNFKPKEYTLILDDEKTVQCKPFFVTFANSSQFGYNAEISPKASVQDGLLSTCFVYKFSKIGALMRLPFLAIGAHEHFKGFKVFDCKSIDIKIKKPMALHTDGEYLGDVTEVSYRCLPGKMRFMV